MADKASTRAPAAELRLDSPITAIKGVGEARARLFAKLGIETAGDLLTNYPRRFEDRSRKSLLAEVPDGHQAVFHVHVVGVENRFTNSGKHVTRLTVEDSSGQAIVAFFNQPWLRDKFMRVKMHRAEFDMYGTVFRNGLEYAIELRDVEYDDGKGEAGLMMGRVVPFYSLTEGLSMNTMRKFMNEIVPRLAPLLEEPLPDDLCDRLDLMPVQEAVRQYHWPDSMAACEAARRRLVFEELFLLQLALALRRKHETLDVPGITFEVPDGFPEAFEGNLPYRFTDAQRRVVGEILDDMRRPRPMNRLLQGDVGSGKTVVAATAMAAAAKAGYQAAVMAPTEILAEQHYRGLSALLEPIGYTVELLKGSLTQKEKREVRERLAFGLTQIAVGTHALIQESVEFRNLGLIVVDEQHRFGVDQRAALKGKGASPDNLVMTATPIPRTLALVVYGDLDISVINELPPGRIPITTHVRPAARRQEVYAGVEALLAAGRQAYVVCPHIEESEKMEVQAATTLYEELQRVVFPHRRVGLLHGQMPAADKDAAMTAFREHEIDVLVATTVIEVGVDVANATVMVIESADRFGLSQLHQLRGRVGRGSNRSFCILVADPATAGGEQRLQVMETSSDGFAIAEEDLRLRGPGEFYGKRQSGMPSLKVANIVDDLAVLEETRREAFSLLEADPELRDPAHAALRRAIERHYAEMALATVS
ncbi:MAG TPA: ATP-dependent DNA helicase RecG [Armatimonadota bacterium]|jgi:ATP-dependent DNA helicase RecG